MQNISRGMNTSAAAETSLTTANNVTQNDTGSDVITGSSQTTGGDCILLQFEEYVPWDNPDNWLSAEVEEMTDQIKNTIILPILFLIGGPANVINMAVFWKQGLRERINLCLFSLSLADELYFVYFIVMTGERMYTQFSNAERRIGPLTKFMTNHNMVGFFGFTWVSQVISAIIASERCFCVVSPLRSQHVLTTRIMGVIIVGVYVTVIGVYFLVASRYHVSCVVDPETGAIFNAVVGGEFYHRNKDFINYLDSFVYGVGLPGLVIIIVVSTTIVTTIKLRQSAAWRATVSSASATQTTVSTTNTSNQPNTPSITTNASSSSSTDTTASMKSSTTDSNISITGSRTNTSKTTTTITSREVALTKMLIGASVLFIVCVMPISIFRFVLLFLPELTAGGRQHNTFFFSLWVLEIFSLVNSSFNIVIYYTMGSRFRGTLKDIFCMSRCHRSGRETEVVREQRQKEEDAVNVSIVTEITEAGASSSTMH